ncbi:ASPIC/UnbV protein [Litoreibacter ponti]|uniref:ASPIC/UnbV protein n=1 Tax=Litoreibacter ponti TaxID=1510457 RepID=A0A2T6BJS0_9RHOB|nr:CRTAC1 family protein [Litoreibacter ponti]PTX56282.1 ASPIC/UnbV protein [Litoreibacter ponti]
MGRYLILLCLPGMAYAEPAFEPVELAEPHIYTGGWEHFVGGGVAVLDCNGDALPEFVAAGGAKPMALYRNGSVPGEMRFTRGEIAPLEGVTGLYPLDIDSDGMLDLAVLRVGANVLLRGGPECSFTDATAEWGFDGGDRWSTAFSATWEQGRDWPTLAVGNYVDRSNPDGPFEACDVNEVHRASGSDGYEKTDLEPGFCALSMLFSDWQRSGTQDLRVSNDRHYYVRGGSEQMWAMPQLTLREGDGWKPISIWGMGIASQDITGDGRPEVVLTSMGDQLMQIASPEGYSAAPFGIGTYAARPYTGGDGRPSTGWHAQFGDINNDGRDDLFIAKGNVDQMPGMATKDPNNLLIQKGDGTFEERGAEAGIASLKRSRGAGLADFDGDGRLDLVVINRRAPLQLYRNISADTGNWLAFDPRQSGANTRAVGAWIELRLGDRVIAKEITVGGGHVSGQAVAVHVGLGDAERAEARIIWPDGVEGPWQSFEAGRIHRLTR